MRHCSTDILVIGAGAAGLVTALELAPKKVMVLAKAPAGEGSSSAWAQGGIAAAVAPEDDPAQHLADTLKVSGEIGSEKVAHTLTRLGPKLIEKLIRWGVQFDRDDNGHLSLSREAAHAHRRVLHAGGDSTGAEIMRALGQAVEQADHISLKPDLKAFRFVVKKQKIVGVWVADQNNQPILIETGAVVLATGGIGQLFGVTTNPSESCGEGLAMAAMAGAALQDLEFVQFHPTAMDIGLTPMPLATEALRGEGAKLRDEAGHRFMCKLHPDAELAPRDVVARAIWDRVKKGQSVYLDCRQAVGAAFQDKFPTVWSYCQKVGLEPSQDLIPIKPAAHYHMGGVGVDENGRTSLKGLWAVGEVACNGVHGANRLASNSLLEAVVFGQIVAQDLLRSDVQSAPVGPVDLPRMSGSSKDEKLARILYLACGVERSAQSLNKGLDEITALENTLKHPSVFFENRLLVSKMILTMALMRRESRGAHYRADYPQTRAAYAHHTTKTLFELEQDLSALRAGTIRGSQDRSWPKTTTKTKALS